MTNTFNAFVKFPNLKAQGVSCAGGARFTPDQITAMYGSYVNDFLTVSRFASHYGLRMHEARQIIKTGRILWDERATQLKAASALQLVHDRELLKDLLQSETK